MERPRTRPRSRTLTPRTHPLSPSDGGHANPSAGQARTPTRNDCARRFHDGRQLRSTGSVGPSELRGDTLRRAGAARQVVDRPGECTRGVVPRTADAGLRRPLPQWVPPCNHTAEGDGTEHQGLCDERPDSSKEISPTFTPSICPCHLDRFVGAGSTTAGSAITSRTRY